MRAVMLAALLAAASGPAMACTLLIPAGGTLGLSADGTRLGSQEPGGAGGSITVVSLFSSTITIGAPAIIQSPGGFNTAGASVQLAYAGLGGLAWVQQGYTGVQTQFTVSGIASATLVNIHSRIISPAGFATGTYRTRTVVTCS